MRSPRKKRSVYSSFSAEVQKCEEEEEEKKKNTEGKKEHKEHSYVTDAPYVRTELNEDSKDGHRNNTGHK